MYGAPKSKLDPKEYEAMLRGPYGPRCPMDELPEQYRVTASNPEPTLVHFAIPTSAVSLYRYAEKHNLNTYLEQLPLLVAPSTVFSATEHLSQVVEYEIELNWPFKPTADCGVILTLFDNYTIEDKLLVADDQEDVIELVQKELGLGKSVRPKWYFDVHDPWRPEEKL